MALQKARKSAKGIAYSGITTHYGTGVGRIIIVAEDIDTLELVATNIESGPFDPALCMPVSVFSDRDTKAE